MSAGPAVLLIDDGELDQVADLLDGLEVDYARESDKSGSIPPQPSAMLVTTSQIAIARSLRRSSGPETRDAVWIAFVAGSSKTERAALERAGFNFLVRQPVHPAALRLLLLHGLYRGEDKRVTRRLAFGFEVRFGGRLFKRRGTLADLSPRGCRLLARRPPQQDTAVQLSIPSEAPGGHTLRLSGRVVRTAAGEGEGGDPQETSVGILFDPLGDRARQQLGAILLERAHGPAVLRRPPGRDSKPARDDARRHPRVEFTQELSAVAASDAHVVLGRDLSEGGMRIEAHPQVQLDDELFLAIQSPNSSESFFVEGRVVRDDGGGGLAVEFQWIEPGGRERLQSLVGSLPPIEQLSRDDAGRGATVLSQWLATLFRLSGS